MGGETTTRILDKETGKAIRGTGAFVAGVVEDSSVLSSLSDLEEWVQKKVSLSTGRPVVEPRDDRDYLYERGAFSFLRRKAHVIGDDLDPAMRAAGADTAPVVNFAIDVALTVSPGTVANLAVRGAQRAQSIAGQLLRPMKELRNLRLEVHGISANLPNVRIRYVGNANRPFSTHPLGQHIDQAQSIGRLDFTSGWSSRASAARLGGSGDDVLIYWVVDAHTRQVLKVGSTTVGGAQGRWSQYTGKAQAERMVDATGQPGIAIEYIRFDSSVPRIGLNAPEAILRREFRAQSHQLPWDWSGLQNTGRTPASFPEAP